MHNELGIRAAQVLKHKQEHRMVLVKSEIMIGSIQPYLQALQTIEPLDIPFARYLQLPAHLRQVEIEGPAYSRLPDFRWDIKSLLRTDIDDSASSVFDPNDAESVREARVLLEESSLLDASQANAIVDMLTQEVALVQG